MRIVTLTQADLINAGCNGLKVLGFAATGCLITVAVDKIAHKVFDIQEYKSKGSFVIKVVAVLCGLAPTLYFGGQVTFVTFTARKTFELFLLTIPLRYIPILNDVSSNNYNIITRAFFIRPTTALNSIIIEECTKTAFKVWIDKLFKTANPETDEAATPDPV